MKTEIIRSEESEGMFGVMLVDEEAFCRTIERPDLGNIPNVSCIPEGVYECQRNESPQFGQTFEVVGVPDRTLIKFHWGSFVTDYKGCIGLGRKVGYIGQQRALYATKDTFKAFMQRMAGIDRFDLTIRKV